MKKMFACLILFTSVFATRAVAQDKDIVDTAISAGSFNTLVAAVQAAGLEGALRGEGPLTVFAPTDEAFAAVPEEVLNGLLADPEALSGVLLYHVAAGELLAGEVISQDSIPTLQGSSLNVSVTGDGVFIDGSTVIATDILATNGVIHVIDAVLLPPAPEPTADIVDTAIGAGRFETLVTAVVAAGLEEALRGEGPFTVFAPNDEAFAKLPGAVLDGLLADPEALANVLLYHVVPGAYPATDVVTSSSLTTLQGQRASITVNEMGAFIDDAKIIGTDIFTSNGIIHEIDSVILPPEKTGTPYQITVTNLTRGQVFSPPVAVVHSADVSLFQLGQPATGALATLAEEGMFTELETELKQLDMVYDFNAYGAPVHPGETVQFEVVADEGFRVISVAGMLTATNDTFFSVEIPIITRFGWLKTARDELGSELAWAYDAGTEFNSESCEDIPGGPCGSAGVRNSAEAEGYIYLSNGVHGLGDLDASMYTWNGPVALVTIKRL